MLKKLVVFVVLQNPNLGVVLNVLISLSSCNLPFVLKIQDIKMNTSLLKIYFWWKKSKFL